jgi:hypothetical protein
MTLRSSSISESDCIERALFLEPIINNSGNYLFGSSRINVVNGPYDFLTPLNRLMKAYNKFEMKVYALNAVIFSIIAYALAEILGISAFMNFYWQDFLLLTASPAILSIILGVIGATLVKRRKKFDIFLLLGSELSEKTRTAYDNRDVKSLPMESLAKEIKSSLSRIRPSEIISQKRIAYRVLLAVILSGITLFIGQSQITADITPADFQSISDLKDKAFGVFQKDKNSDTSTTQNLSTNLFGKPSLAVLSESKMELLLYPGVGAGSMARNTEPVERAFQKSLAGEAAIVPSELYIETLPPENKEIIKKYFTILSENQ